MTADNFWFILAVGVFVYQVLFRRHQIHTQATNVLTWTRIITVSAGLAAVGLLVKLL